MLYLCSMISVQNLTVEFSARPVFDGISYVVNNRDRIALVGRNGAGKTTMLRVIAGLQRPTSGSVAVPADTTIGYLPQQMEVYDSLTVVEEVGKAFAHIDEMQRKVDDLNRQLAERTDYESAEYHAIIEKVSSLSERLLIERSDNREAEMERTLMGLGFSRDDFSRPTGEFSGGWRMRIELAKLLLQHPDVLLLDEPTNHLDIESIQWLENFLITKAKAVMLVSHDRTFLDNVTTRTIEISLGRIYDYAVSYTKFKELQRERIEQQMRAYNNQQKQIQDTEAFIERFRYKATKAVQVQSRIKALEKIERIEVDQVDTSHISLRFPPAPRSGDYPVIAEGVAKAYGEHQVFSGVELTIKRGEKVAFVGKNGEGKSTLVKCIMNEIPYDGSLRIGHNVKIGYFAQNQAQLLDGELTVFDTIDRVAVGDIRTRIRDLLGAFMFYGDDIDKKVKVLSGGEKSRLAMIRLLLEPVNLLILDEPTNHLDIDTKAILKRALKLFNGTAIIVSHDRDFLSGLVDRVFEFGGGKVRECLGGIGEFLSRLKRANTLETQVSSAVSEKNAPSTKKNDETLQQKKELRRLSYREERERAKLLKQAQRKVDEAEAEITAIEAEIAEIERKISEGETDNVIFESHAAATKRLENAMSLWEIASMNLSELQERFAAG